MSPTTACIRKIAPFASLIFGIAAIAPPEASACRHGLFRHGRSGHASICTACSPRYVVVCQPPPPPPRVCTRFVVMKYESGAEGFVFDSTHSDFYAASARASRINEKGVATQILCDEYADGARGS